MVYKFNEKVPVKALADLRESVGWNRMETEYKNPLMTSYYHIAVYEDEKLIGYIDSVSNGVTDAYIQDLMVCPDHQGKGIGTDLMEKMIEYLKKKHIYMISVVYEEGLEPFYDRFGFYHMLCGQMETYWDRTWEMIAPERISSYAASIDTAEDAIIAFLQEKKAKYVCDAGCGCGIYSLKLARFGFAVSGFDIAEDAVLLTKKLLSENGYSAKDFKQANVLSTGYPSKCFDAVVARDVIDHMPIKQGINAVKELLRIVRPGGCVLLTLDATDSEYESEPHKTNKDGDYLFIRGKWSGMAFHPYSVSEIKKLTDGVKYNMLPSNENGFIVVLGVDE